VGGLDAGAHVSSSDTDGIHLDREAHTALGKAVAATIKAIWS
jgi:lysophospholipase L1-like esterase